MSSESALVRFSFDYFGFFLFPALKIGMGLESFCSVWEKSVWLCDFCLQHDVLVGRNCELKAILLVMLEHASFLGLESL